ncbi:MAG: hypothetical protein COA84_04980 [Robiginitomaculum sp.]|nr:MAG: hypothetical protein COA84_04980 [Robiginitomaculum sp.]
MNIKTMIFSGSALVLFLSSSTAAFAEKSCGGPLYGGKCFEKLPASDCVLTPFIFDDDENVIGGGGLICTSVGPNGGSPISIKINKEDVKTLSDGSGGKVTYISAAKLAEIKTAGKRPVARPMGRANKPKFKAK